MIKKHSTRIYLIEQLGMFRLFANLRWKGYHNPYDDNLSTPAMEIDPSTVALDPIHLSKDGCDWRGLVELCKSFAPLREKVLKILDGDDAEIQLGPIVQPTFFPTARKWLVAFPWEYMGVALVRKV